MIQKLILITNFTFRELLKSKILFATFGIAFALVVMTYVATEFTYGVPEKIALDFGLGMLSVSSLGISLFMGATLLSKEIDSRTVYMIISRPVPRWVFITGKILGLVLILILNVAILSGVMITCTLALGGIINSVMIYAVIFNILECILLLLTVVFFSLFTNTILSTIISLVVLVSGHAVKDTLSLVMVRDIPLLQSMLKSYHLVLPAFYKLNLKDFVLYEQNLDTNYLASTLIYAICYGLFLFLTIVSIFNKKNLD